MEVLRTRLCEWKPVGIDAVALAPKPEEPRLAVGRANGALELWDTSTWHLHSSSAGHARRSIRSFVWVLDEEDRTTCRLFSAGLHKDITEWDLMTLKPEVSIPSGGGAVWALCAHRQRAFAACDDGSVRVFSLEGGPGSISYVRRIHVDEQRLLSIADFGSAQIFAGGSSGQITKWSVNSSQCEAKMQVEKKDETDTLIWTLARIGEHTLASGDSLGLVYIWNGLSCTVIRRFDTHQADVLALAASPHGNLLLSGGIDAKISAYVFQPGDESKWVFHNAEFAQHHDIRSLSLDPLGDCRRYVSGGVSGSLMFSEVRLRNQGCSEAYAKFHYLFGSCFSPFLQTGSIAQGSRLFLCQRNEHLELWYLKQPPKLSVGGVPSTCLPESELVLRITLSSADQGQHICASALAPDGRLFAASDASGSRLFTVNLEELEVRREQRLPKEVCKTTARAMLFCSASLLALATWSTHQVVVIGVPQLAIVGRFSEHHAAISPLAAAGEWLASGDASGVVHVFNVDTMEHHAQVPIGTGQGFPTALALRAQKNHLLVVLSSHTVIVFDVEAKTLVASVPPLRIPPLVLMPNQRVCGAVATAGALSCKWLLWTHELLLALEFQPAAAGQSVNGPEDMLKKGSRGESLVAETMPSPDNCKWRIFRDMKHILALHPLDESQWGAPLHGKHPGEGRSGAAVLNEDEASAPAKRRRSEQAVQTMVLTFEVSPEAVSKALPPAFERKRFGQIGRRSSTEARV
mmetsp:Transcript_63497/g.148022  ORF Transcript_63497/g.148022 Transcript_63497/m.148022 type:complete len:746 (+) Transcript_63497:108-2345(+)